LWRKYKHYTQKAEEVWDEMGAFFIPRESHKFGTSLPGEFLKHKKVLVKAIEEIERLDKKIRLK
jgi:hypothetical protein